MTKKLLRPLLGLSLALLVSTARADQIATIAGFSGPLGQAAGLQL